VEHPCYSCHAEIPESAAFCPHCGAPQIRVVAPEAPSEEQPVPVSDGLNQAAPPAAVPPWIPASAYPPLPGAVHWPLAWKDALLCGVGAAVLFVLTVPVIRLGGVLWMPLAGALAVRLYRRHIAGAPVTAGMGMKLGALTGLFGFLANAFTSIVSFVALRNAGNLRHAMEEQMQSQMAGNSDPRVQQMMQNLLDYMSTPQGAATMIAFFLLIFGMVFVVLCAAGGAVGASMFGQRRGPQ